MAVIGCTQPSTPPTPAMPWLDGFSATAASDKSSSQVADKLRPWQSCPEPCADYGGLEIAADIAPATGVESVLASYSSGVVVLDARGRLLARGSAFEPGGSADEVVALTVGDASLGEPVIAVAARTGGHREGVVWLELYRVGKAAKLERLFAAIVEQYDGERVSTGSVTLSRDELVFRAPGRELSERWIFDRRAGLYLRGAKQR